MLLRALDFAFTLREPTSLTLGSQPALIMAVTVPREDEWHLYSLGGKQINPTTLLEEFPDVWAEKGAPGLAPNHAPIVVELRPGATPVTQK